MVVTINANTYENWKIFKKLVSSLEYSHDYPKFSLDEHLTFTRNTSRVRDIQKYTAKEIVDVIGEEVFKALVERLWEPTHYRTSIKDVDIISTIVLRGIRWSNSQIDWNTIYHKLVRAGL